MAPLLAASVKVLPPPDRHAPARSGGFERSNYGSATNYCTRATLSTAWAWRNLIQVEVGGPLTLVIRDCRREVYRSVAGGATGQDSARARPPTVDPSG